MGGMDESLDGGRNFNRRLEVFFVFVDTSLVRGFRRFSFLTFLVFGRSNYRCFFFSDALSVL